MLSSGGVVLASVLVGLALCGLGYVASRRRAVQVAARAVHDHPTAGPAVVGLFAVTALLALWPLTGFPAVGLPEPVLTGLGTLTGVALVGYSYTETVAAAAVLPSPGAVSDDPDPVYRRSDWVRAWQYLVDEYHGGGLLAGLLAGVTLLPTGFVLATATGPVPMALAVLLLGLLFATLPLVGLYLVYGIPQLEEGIQNRLDEAYEDGLT